MATSLSRRCPLVSSPVCGRGFRDLDEARHLERAARGGNAACNEADLRDCRELVSVRAATDRRAGSSFRPAMSVWTREAGRVNCHPNRRLAVPLHFGAEAGQGAVPVHARDSRSRRERAVLAATPAGAPGSLRGCRGTKVPTRLITGHGDARPPAKTPDVRRIRPPARKAGSPAAGVRGAAVCATVATRECTPDPIPRGGPVATLGQRAANGREPTAEPTTFAWELAPTRCADPAADADGLRLRPVLGGASGLGVTDPAPCRWQQRCGGGCGTGCSFLCAVSAAWRGRAGLTTLRRADRQVGLPTGRSAHCGARRHGERMQAVATPAAVGRPPRVRMSGRAGKQLQVEL